MAIKAKISKELQNTVADCPNVELVHFDAEGNHYFNVHEYANKSDKKHNGLYGRISVRILKDNQTGREDTVETPDFATRIVETIHREDIRKADVSTFGITGLDGLSPTEKSVILKMRNK